MSSRPSRNFEQLADEIRGMVEEDAALLLPRLDAERDCQVRLPMPTGRRGSDFSGAEQTLTNIDSRLACDAVRRRPTSDPK
ncbi:MAG: hypothetical protein ABMA15_12325 [Vicinamibacterales bacterium]